MKKRTFNILKYLLVVLFVNYYCESTLFFHTHNFAWGTVTHSHPYMPTGGHSHSSAECQTIQFLTNLLFTAVVGVAFVAIPLGVSTHFYAPRLHSLARHILENCSLRAPPVLIC